MKIKTLNLKSYGKFENKEFNFKEGLNIIYGINGSGKSTISTALKAFLYKDLKGEGKYKKTYIPLGEKQGAYDVLFETDDKEEYETMVTAGATAAKTIHKTVKLSENREVASGCDVGEYFFSALEDIYDSVCFIKEPDDFEKVTKNDKAVNEKLSQNSAKERSSVDITEAIELLNKERLSFARQTPTGLIYPKEKEVEELNETLLEIENISFEDIRLKKTEEELKKDIGIKKEEKQKLSGLLYQHTKYEEYEKYLNSKKGKERAEELKKELDELKIEKCELSNNEISKIKEADSFKEEKSPLFLLSFGIAFVFAVLSFMFPLCMIFTAVFLMLGSVAFILQKKKNGRLKEAVLNEKFKILNSVNCRDLEEYYVKNNLYNKALIKKESLSREIENIISLTTQDEVKEAEYAPKPEGNAIEVKNRLAALNEEITLLELKLASISERRKSLYNNLPSYEELKERKEELEKELDELKYDEKVTLAALDMLEVTRAKYKTSYLPALAKRAEEILMEAEENLADKLVIDESFSPSLREKNDIKLKDKEHLSSGVSDGVYFAVRLAVLETVFKGREKPVIILDDPFVRMDDEKAALWIKYLMKNKEFQIIYFTAGKRIFNLGLENNTILAL